MKFLVSCKNLGKCLCDTEEFEDYLDICEILYERDINEEGVWVKISPDNMFFILEALSLYRYSRKITINFKTFTLYLEKKEYRNKKFSYR